MTGAPGTAGGIANPAALVLVALSVGFGVIGVAIGFATVLGTAATASGDAPAGGYGPLIVTAASTLTLGVVLISGGVLLWRAARASRAVIGAGLALLAVSALVRMTLDTITFSSVIGGVFSACAIVGMGVLLASDGVRDHVRRGVPLRLR